MKNEVKDKFVFSQRNANIFGYNVGMTKTGQTFSYTTVVNISRQSERPAYEIEGDTVYTGTIEDLVAIKRYNGVDSEYIKNTTKKIDPFNNIVEEKQSTKKICCDFTKNFCNKIKEINRKIKKLLEKEYQNNVT